MDRAKQTTPSDSGAPELDASLREAIERSFGGDALKLLSENGPTGGDANLALQELVGSIDEAIESDVASGGFRAAARSRRAVDSVRQIVFVLGGVRYAAPLDNVLEIQRPPNVTEIPNLPSWIVGVTNLRGDVLSITDLAGFLGLEPLGLEKAGRMIVVRALAEDVSTGLLVERVEGVLAAQKDKIAAAPSNLDSRIAPFCSGVYPDENRLIVLLDIDGLLASTEMRQFVGG